MLTERRHADRLRMAGMIEDLCREFGASCAIEDHSDRRELWCEISFGAARVTIEFCGQPDALPDCYCIPWNIRPDCDETMTAAFGRAVGDEVNPVHRRKCMTFATGIERLLASLRSAFACIADGRAFSNPIRHAA